MKVSEFVVIIKEQVAASGVKEVVKFINDETQGELYKWIKCNTPTLSPTASSTATSLKIKDISKKKKKEPRGGA